MEEYCISEKELEKAFDERFPEEIKVKLKNASVAVAGLGGLGSNIAVMLARSGVGKLFLVDFDRVDVTNINRQAYFVSHIGMEKTTALREILEQINPYMNIETKTVKVTEDNAPELFGSYPIVCEAFDRPDQKAMLTGTLLSSCPGVTVVSGNGMAGYGDANDIRTEKKMHRLYVCGDLRSDTSEGMGLMAPRVAICAGHQANQVIRLILGE